MLTSKQIAKVRRMMNQTDMSGTTDHRAVAPGPLVVQLRPHIADVCYGNITWCGRWPMKHGKFPKGHPVGGGSLGEPGGQFGTSPAMTAFRERGYWASCFPDGDGITWQPLNGQTIEQTADDVRKCFGWTVKVVQEKR